jgi:nicotinamidase-related amidase
LKFRPALVAIDVQNGFVTPASARVVPVITSLVRRWLDAGGEVILTRYANYPGSPFERLIGWYGLHSAPATDLVDELAPFTSHDRVQLISKVTYSALNEDSRHLITDGGFTDLFLCGIATDGCVMATALAAFDAGITPWVLTDACASNATSMPPAEVHRAALMLLTRLIGAGQLISSEQALRMLGTVSAVSSRSEIR